MSQVANRQAIPAMTPAAIANVAVLEQAILSLPQVRIHTHHVLHAGLYSRTIIIPNGVVLTGAVIKIATLLVICGDVEVNRGSGDSVRINGTAVLPASAGRKQAFIAYEDTSVTMTFSTRAKTVEEAEAEFTDDGALLFSRRDADLNTITITGE